MAKTLVRDNQKAKQQPETATVRHFEPEEFDADTDEERPVALLAERRRQFLAGLRAQQANPAPAADK